jgi:hypothetical protein
MTTWCVRTNTQNTKDVPIRSTSAHSEHIPEELGRPLSNPNPPVTNNDVDDIGLTTNDNQNSTMCENRTSMCQENIYENDSEYRLNSNDEFKVVTNK